MNEGLRKLIEQGHASGYTDGKSILELLAKDDVQFSAEDSRDLRNLLAHGWGRTEPVPRIPDWLREVFAVLARKHSPMSICDPWAGMGFLIETISTATGAQRSYALSPNETDARIGRALTPGIDWTFFRPTELLKSIPRDVDLFASMLPLGVKTDNPFTIEQNSREIEIRSDLGGQVLVAASLKLGPTGVGLFVVPPMFFVSERSVRGQLTSLGLGVNAALALPPGTFAPYTNIGGYLVIIRPRLIEKTFVAQLSSDVKTNSQILENYSNAIAGGTLDLGRFVESSSFRGLDEIRAKEKFAEAQLKFRAAAIPLEALSKQITLGRPGRNFKAIENSIYIPILGVSGVVTSPEDFALKPQSYAQVVIDESRSQARFVAHFLNSEFGKEILEMNKAGFISKLNLGSLRSIQVFVPDLATQNAMLETEGRIASEFNIVLGLQNELGELRRDLWGNPRTAESVNQRLSSLSNRLSGSLKQHAAANLDQWFETLPFPLASILRAWQATPTADFKTKYEHLLHFFEATAEFIGLVFLSAFGSNPALFETHKPNLVRGLKSQNLSLDRATFGTWKVVAEYFGKQIRHLLANDKDSASLCATIFTDPSNEIPSALSSKQLIAIISTTNKMRNDWLGHTGVVSQELAKLRNEELLGQVQNLRDAMADVWTDTQLIHALLCIPRNGIFNNEISILMGSNSEFLKETRSMASWLDVEHLYLSKKGSKLALKLLPLIKLGPSPESARNACYFYNRLEEDSLRFISYHFGDRPETKISKKETLTQELNFLWSENDHD